MEAKSPLDWLDDDSRRRSAAGLHRVLRPRDPAAPLLDLASNDYLGLSLSLIHISEPTRRS